MKKRKKENIIEKFLLFKGNRKGSSYWFIYTMIFLFALTILYIVFNQTLRVYIYPTTQTLTGGDTSKADRWLSFWDFVPFVILLIAGMFLFFKLTQRDTQTGE